MQKVKAFIIILALYTTFIFSITTAISNSEESDETAEMMEVMEVAEVTEAAEVIGTPSATYIPYTSVSTSMEKLTIVISDEPEVEEREEDQETSLPDEDIGLIALVTMAEAEGECEEGKRLVIDTILNRMDSEHFPDTAYDVIYQPYQFSSMWNGRVDRCEIQEDICQLVREELESRTSYDVIFFTAGRYSDYGVPLFQVENHYFSSYK